MVDISTLMSLTSQIFNHSVHFWRFKENKTVFEIKVLTPSCNLKDIVNGLFAICLFSRYHTPDLCLHALWTKSGYWREIDRHILLEFPYLDFTISLLFTVRCVFVQFLIGRVYDVKSYFWAYLCIPSSIIDKKAKSVGIVQKVNILKIGHGLAKSSPFCNLRYNNNHATISSLYEDNLKQKPNLIVFFTYY